MTKKKDRQEEARVCVVNAAYDSPEFLHALDSIVLDSENARRHDARSIEAIAASLATFGQQKPVVLVGNKVIAGNGAVVAARKLGWTHIAAVAFPDEHTARAYALADNRTAELSQWDNTALAAALDAVNAQGLADATGFTVDEMMKIAGEVTDAAIVAAGKPEEKAIAPEVAAAAQRNAEPLVGNTSHVRMVQLFLNEETHPIFMERIRALSAVVGKDNVTDVVFEAVRVLYESKGLDKMKEPAS